MKENLPEEKLLKLIRVKRPDKQKPPAATLGKTKKSFEVHFFLACVNGILMIGAFALVGFLVYRVFFARPEESVTVPPASSLNPDPVQIREAIGEKKPFEYYKNQFSKRDLFERPLDQVAANASVDLTKRYKLVGIVLGAVPEAIVEDLTTRNTMFVREGERLDTVEVKKIEEGRIIFLQEGLEIELKQ